MYNPIQPARSSKPDQHLQAQYESCMLLWSFAPVYDSYAFKLLGTSFLRVNTGRVFTSSFSANLASDNRKSLENIRFSNSLNVKRVGKFQ